jgi:release factor glutamine methyltransferase
VYWVFAEEHGWSGTRNHTDLAGRDRFITARSGGWSVAG